MCFYEKVIKVKADVAAFLINLFSDVGIDASFLEYPRGQPRSTSRSGIFHQHLFVWSQNVIDPLRLSLARNSGRRRPTVAVLLSAL
jgi:hypothetical protein